MSTDKLDPSSSTHLTNNHSLWGTGSPTNQSLIQTVLETLTKVLDELFKGVENGGKAPGAALENSAPAGGGEAPAGSMNDLLKSLLELLQELLTKLSQKSEGSPAPATPEGGGGSGSDAAGLGEVLKSLKEVLAKLDEQSRSVQGGGDGGSSQGAPAGDGIAGAVQSLLKLLEELLAKLAGADAGGTEGGGKKGDGAPGGAPKSDGAPATPESQGGLANQVKDLKAQIESLSSQLESQGAGSDKTSPQGDFGELMKSLTALIEALFQKLGLSDEGAPGNSPEGGGSTGGGQGSGGTGGVPGGKPTLQGGAPERDPGHVATESDGQKTSQQGEPTGTEKPLPSTPGGSEPLSSSPQSTANSADETKKISEQYISQLQQDFGLTREQAVGIVANLSHESAGMNSGINQGGAIGAPSGNSDINGSGYGIAQWGGARKEGLIEFAQQHGLDPSSQAANYGYLKQELSGEYKSAIDAVKGTSTAADATLAFCNSFEKPTDPQMNSRLAIVQQLA